MHAALAGTPATPNFDGDVEVAQRIAAGDRAELTRLMRRHNQKLYRTARAILRDDAEAEDAVQESWLSAYRAMGAFRADARMSTWLVRIVANEALGRLRRRSRRAEVIVLADRIDGERPDADDVQGAATSRPGPEEQAMHEEFRRLVEAGIDRLPDGFRAVFVLRAVEEMSVDETAAALGIAEATVRSRYFRARGLLRAALSRETDLAVADAFGFAGASCDRIVAGVFARLPGMQAPDA